MATGTLVKSSSSKAEGTATELDVLEGKTFSNSSGVGLLGRMPNNGLIEQVLTAENTQIELNGKYDEGSVVKIVPYTLSIGVSSKAHSYEAPAGKVITKVETTACPGDATPSYVLSGKTFSGNEGICIAGKMVNNGAVKVALDAFNVLYTIPEGYHNGRGTVGLEVQDKVATLKTTQQTITADDGKVLRSVDIPSVTGTATPGSVAKGYTFSSAAGVNLTGTMIDYGSTTVTANSASISSAKGNLIVNMPTAGYYNTSSKVSMPLSGIYTMIKLGTGTSFDVTSIPGYQKLTAGDFIVEPHNGSVTEEGHSNDCKRGGSGSYNLTKIYNSATGILKAYGTLSCAIHCSDGNNFGNSVNVAVTAYLNLGGVRSK